MSKTNCEKSQNGKCSPFKVVRSYDGILRLKYDNLFRDLDRYEQPFVDGLLAVEGITDVRLSNVTKTVAIVYDCNRLDDATVITRVIKNGFRRRKNGNGRSTNLPRWNITFDQPGRLRLKNPILYRNPIYCGRVENLLLNMLEVKKYKVSKLTTSVLIHYDEARVTRNELVDLLDEVVRETKPEEVEQNNRLAVTTAIMGLSFMTPVSPWLIPVNFLLILNAASPTFKSAFRSIFVERKMKVDVLDAIIIFLSTIMGQLGVAAFMVWVLDVAGSILDKTTEQSRKLLVATLGRQAHFAYLYKDDIETKVSVGKLKKDDVVIVHTGDSIPVDGTVVDGEAMVDQASMTGEAAPAEKKTGDKVFASTTVVAGKAFVRVEASGEETNAAKIVRIINETARYKTKTHNLGAKIADKMVLPTLGLAAIGSVTGGASASLAIINCDFGTGIRVAAPTAVLSTLARAARNGILIKDGRVLEDIQKVDAFLFDKTGTLTNEVPEIARIVRNNGHFNEEDILRFAATAEGRFTHPIAKAIVKEAKGLGLKLPPIDNSRFHVGFGIQVGINGNEIKVGSIRYMEREGISIPSHVGEELEHIHKEGRSAIMVAVDDELAGAIELKASQRPEAADLIKGLKARGIKELVLISGDHEAATRDMATRLGMTRYFAEVLPQDKASYVKRLQAEGRKVAMVGDGINDSVALSQADVSISLSGASSVATDVAKVVFMDGSLAKTESLFEISNMLTRNINRSFKMIAIPNIICITGAMFGVFGLSASLILNNGFNMMATVNGMAPMFAPLEDPACPGGRH